LEQGWQHQVMTLSVTREYGGGGLVLPKHSGNSLEPHRHHDNDTG